MKKTVLLLTLLTMICSVPGAEAQQASGSPEPTLEQTLGWIKEKINLYRDVKVPNMQGRSMTESYEVTRVSGCNLEIRHTETQDDVKVSTVYELPLPGYRELSMMNCQLLTIYTREESIKYVETVEGPGGRRESSTGTMDHVVIYTRRKDIDNCDLQKRLKKAFDHAAELCREHPKDQR